MEEQRASPDTDGVTYGFREVSLKSHEKKAKPRRASRCCPSWLRDGDGIDRSWKPVSLTTPVLALLAALSLLIAAAIETLAQRSSAHGGLALSATLDDIPQWASFAYKYVPNIAAALYSLLWSWVDLDVKRMQPWFEMSRPGGARGEDSLFLDYPCEFVAFVPWTSLKKRHWPVFLSGTTVMIIFWVITPLQSAIFGTGVVQRTETVSIANRSQLLPINNQTDLGSKLLNTGYAIAWLGQEYPPFMTADYALLPYYVDRDPAPKSSEANWTATTTKLSTELTCWPASISRKVPWTREFYFLNGQGCNATIIIDFLLTTPYSMSYVGYYSSPYSDFALADWDCPKTPDSVHQFLAIWAKNPDPRIEVSKTKLNITALYCQSHYYKQEVMVTVSAGSLKPHDDSIQPVSEKKPLTESEFNSTAFEYVIANGMPVGAEGTVKDRPFTAAIEQNPRLAKYQLRPPASSMVGYALAGQNLSTEAYAEPKVLEEAFNHAQKYLFSVAVSQILVNGTTFSNHTASSTYPLSGIIVSRVFSIVVESLLEASAILTITLLWLCHTAPCHLRENPNSISRLADIFQNSPDVLDTFRKLDNADGKSLFTLFQNDVFRLSRQHGTDGRELYIERVVETDSDRTERKLDAPEAYYDPIRPFALTRKMGFIFLLILLSAIAVIAWLKAEEVIQKGLPRPSTSFEVLQILENYLPTAFATLVEPFWVLLNRLMCVMQPFQELWAGKARPTRSIDTTYSAIPPQLTIWRAIKARHFVLVVVCVTTLVANLLGIGLGALFNEAETTVKYRQEFKPKLAAKFADESVAAFIHTTNDGMVTTGHYQDHVYIAMTNISNGTPLPPWITPDYFFLPHRIVASNGSLPADTYKLQTRGFGANLECTPASARPIPIDGPRQPSDLYNGPSTCPEAITTVGAEFRQEDIPNNGSTGPYAGEVCALLNQNPTNPCNGTYVLGWGRFLTGGGQRGPMEASYAICKPIFETAMFDVVVDASGNVLSYNRTTDIESSLDFPQSDSLVARIILNAGVQLSWRGPTWHNDTLTRDWLSHLMMITIGSRDFLDPKKPVPDPAKMIPVAGDIYRRTFAILLGINQESLFERAAAKDSVTGTRSTRETRIFLDHTALIITLTVLSINVIVTVLFYARAAVFVLPRMPTSIGSILAYIAPSRAVTGSGRHGLGRQNRTFSFGRYLGVDGSVHIGIEMDPHVVPIDPASLRETKTMLDRLPPGLWRRRKAGLLSGTWL